MLKFLLEAKDPKYIPKKAHSTDSGYDLMAATEESVTLAPGERCLVPTGIAISLPKGFEAQIRPRSGLAAKHGITVLNTPATIDQSYTGEIKVILINHSQDNYIICNGDRIAQLVINKLNPIEMEIVEEINKDTDRGEKGFGSSGR